MPVRMFIHVI